MNIRRLMASAMVATSCIGALSAVAEDWTYSSGTLTDGNWTLTATIKSGNITISGVTAGTGALDLSKPCTGGKIAAVGSSAFKDNTNITALNLPDAAFTIGTYAFQNCVNLSGKLSLGAVGRVTLSYAGGNRDSYAFANTGIQELEIGLMGMNVDSTPMIMKGTFQGCTSLTSLTFTADCDLTTIKNDAFKGCTSLKTVTPLLPATIKSLGCATFSGCPIEGKLTLGQNVNVAIGHDGSGGRNSYAFKDSKITEVEFGEAQTALDTCSYLFQNCSELEKISFLSPDLTSVYSKTVIDNCPKLREVAFSGAKPSIGTGWIANMATGQQVRFTYPKTSTAWNDYVAGLGTGLTAWDDAAGEGTPEAAYKETFADWETLKPVGYTKKIVTAYNIWLVPVKTGAAGDINLGVAGDPVAIGVVSPEYSGTSFPKVEAGTVCKAPRYAEDGDRAWECTGYLLEKQNDDASWSEVKSETGVRSFTLGDEEGTYRLTWKWQKVAYAVKIDELDPAITTASVSGTPFDGGSEITNTYYAAGSVVQATVTPAAGQTFVRWYGPVAAGDETKLTANVTVTDTVGLSPYFATPWAYDGKAKTLSDGYWTFATSGSAAGLTLASVVKRPLACTLLDLRKDLGDVSVTSIAASLFEGNATLAEVRLPDTLVGINRAAFSGCTSLRTVTPLLPASVTWIATDAFYNAPVEGKLELGLAVTVEFGQDGSGAHVSRAFAGTRITELTLGEVKGGTVYAAAFQNCTALAKVTFASKTIRSLNDNAFDGCTALRTVTPLLPESVFYLGAYAFRNCPVEGRLTLGKAGNFAFDCATGGQRPAYTFQGAAIGELELGRGVTNNWFQGLFKDCASLTNVWIAGFPHANATYGALYSDVFTGVPAHARFFLRRDSEEWSNWLTNTTKATPWQELDDDAKAEYYAAWGEGGARPAARATGAAPFPSGVWLLRYSDAAPGMMFLVK